VRVDGEKTVQIDASQAGGNGGRGRFLEASADGAVVFFSDDASADLTSDTVSGSGTNLYRYDVETGQLSDLTPGGAGQEPLIGGMGRPGASEDGSYVYFTARAALTSGAVAGADNLSLWHAGTTTLIGQASCAGLRACWRAVAGNGRFFAFATTQSPTGYDNIDSVTGLADGEIYLYDAVGKQLTCVSCDPSGQRPTAGGAHLLETDAPHPLTGSGRLFFDTAEPLLPRDTNGKVDVYEYENSQVHLISTGTGGQESVLLDASESGDDVFFLTRAALTSEDTQDGLRVIYDARVDGGFPEPVSPPACTTADACRTPVSPQPSIYGAPSSQTFSGQGNLAPPSKTPVKKKHTPTRKARCRKGFLKNRGRCSRANRGKTAKKSDHKRGRR
jgi:hypothetical protein